MTALSLSQPQNAPRARHNMSHFTQRHAASSSGSMTATSSMLAANANRRTAMRRQRCCSVAAAGVIQRTGVDEPVPGGVSRTFAVDIGGASPAKVSLKYPKDTTAVCIESARPLGLVFAQRVRGVTTEIYVDEIVDGSNAAAAGARVGDVLRLTTAVFLVSAPVDVTTWLNPPAKRNVKAYYECDGKSFDNVMNAIASHSVEIDTPSGKQVVETVGMVFERQGAEEGAAKEVKSVQV